MDVWVNTTCDLIKPMRIVEITKMLEIVFTKMFELVNKAPIFWFYEKSLICFFENVLIYVSADWLKNILN